MVTRTTWKPFGLQPFPTANIIYSDTSDSLFELLKLMSLSGPSSSWAASKPRPSDVSIRNTLPTTQCFSPSIYLCSLKRINLTRWWLLIIITIFKKSIPTFFPTTVRCMICSDAERRGVEGNFSILVPRFADHRTDLQHWHAASAFNHEGPLNRTRFYNCMLWAIFGDSEPKICREVAILLQCMIWQLKEVSVVHMLYGPSSNQVLTNVAKKKIQESVACLSA